MNRLRDNKQEEQAAKPEQRRKVKLPRALAGLLNGSFLARENMLRNMPFILFCAGMGLAYITYGYHTERTVRELHRTEAELKEMRSEYITVRSQLEKAEQQSQVAAGISELGLRESRVPPVKIPVPPKHLERNQRP